MALIEFTKEEKAAMVQKVKLYFREELDSDIGQFDAEFLIDFFASEMGHFYYNRALYDAQSLLAEKIDDLRDGILQLEKPAAD